MTGLDNNDDDRIYAKSADSKGSKGPLAEHTIGDIKAARRLVENLPLPQEERERISKILDLILACHDLGKAATGFQASLEKDAHHWGYRHEILSAAVAAALGLDDSIVFPVITHHKQIPSDGTEENTGSRYLPREQLPGFGEDWEEMSRQWLANLSLLTKEWAKICQFIGRQDLTEGLGLAPLSTDMKQWLNRLTQTDFSYEQREYFSFLRGLTISADHIASSGSPLPAAIPRLLDYNITKYDLRGFQIAVSKYRGNLILRAPTGSGKTEAALLFAQLNQQYNGKFFYALPTMASLNAMYLRVKHSFNDKDDSLVGLLHSRSASALYSMFENGHDSTQLNQQKARNLASLVREMYFPIRVCTPHQILRYSLGGKGWEAMLSEFPHSVFVFDEIHAYNPKLTGLIMATVRYLVQHNATCLFVTATLPTFLRKLIEVQVPGIGFVEPSYDNVTDKKILEQKRHILERIDGTIMDNIDFIAEEANRANSTLVVCNHIPTAQAIYNALKDKVSGTMLLNSQFTRKDRNEKESRLLRSKLPKDNPMYEPLPKILVATQVVEVSLDLDFEQCFTEPAAIDALIQRFGRVNRYGEREPANVYIFTKQYSKSNKVYSEELRDSSLEVLTNLANPLTEEDLNAAADKVYGNGYEGKDLEEYNEGLNYPQLRNWKDYLTAGTSKDWIEHVIDEKEGTVELLHEQFLDRYNELRRDKLLIKSNNLLIPVGKWALDKLEIDKSQEEELDVWIIRDCKYSKEIGLEIDGEHTSHVAI